MRVGVVHLPRETAVAFACSCPCGLKPATPLLAQAEPQLKPPSPLRVKNGCFSCVFWLQRCRRFQRLLFRGEQRCLGFQIPGDRCLRRRHRFHMPVACDLGRCCLWPRGCSGPSGALHTCGAGALQPGLAAAHGHRSRASGGVAPPGPYTSGDEVVERLITATSMHAPIAAAITVGRIQPSWFTSSGLHMSTELMCSG